MLGGPGCSREGAGPGSGDDQATLASLVDPEQIASAAHILIMHAESRKHYAEITRSRSEAEDLARRIALLAHERGADFEGLARLYSEDLATRQNGGYIGIFRRGEMVLEFDVAVFNLEIGQTGGVIESPFGFHIIKRLPVRLARAHHILIAHSEAVRRSAGATRTKAQAEILAQEVRRQAVTPGADLCKLAHRFSDDRDNAADCGRLGVLEPGMMPPWFDQVLFRLKPGEVSEVIESPFGYTIIWREE